MGQLPSVAIVGLGRVGLPLGLYLASRGMQVHGIDVDAPRVERIRRGEMPFIEEGGAEALGATLGKTFHPGTSYAAIEGVEVVILTLGTPVDEHMNPILAQLERAVDSLTPHLRPGQLLALRSTVSPGTTEHLARHIGRTTRLVPGRDLSIAYCPERIAEGFSLSELPDIPQIAGGIDAESTARAVAFWTPVCRTVLPTRARAAELAKLFTNMYRYIDFAIANEFMVIAETYDEQIHEIVDLVNQGYRRGGLKRPGLASGPCLFKDGFFLLSRVPFVELISVAWRLHESMPNYLVERLRRERELDGAKVALLGLAFKANIDDTRNSLAFRARKLFVAEGAHVHLHDPFVASEPLDDCLRDADVVFLAMNHDAYRAETLRPSLRLCRPTAVVCDIWNHLGRGTLFPLSSL
jgi:UDP-N-acetyl-D-mannosaminuronic acid dehydrogenase